MLKFSQFCCLVFIVLANIYSKSALAEEALENNLVPDEVVVNAISDLDYKPPKFRLLRSDFVRHFGSSDIIPATE